MLSYCEIHLDVSNLCVACAFLCSAKNSRPQLHVPLFGFLERVVQ